MMYNQGILKSKKQDEYFTPPYAVYPLLEFLKKNKFKKIWCPFDKDDSSFVKILKKCGYEVIYTHKDYNQDFFDTNIKCDAIISNPPYSIKDKVLQRLYELKKPFMMLLPLTALQGHKRYNLFSKYGLELLCFDRRITFNNTPSNCFATAYFCYKVLDKQIEFRSL